MNRMLTLWMQPIYAGINQVTLKSKIFFSVGALIFLALMIPIFYTNKKKNSFTIEASIGLGLIALLVIVYLFWLIFYIKICWLTIFSGQCTFNTQFKKRVKKIFTHPYCIVIHCFVNCRFFNSKEI